VNAEPRNAEILNAAFESCVRVISSPEPGKEKSIFAEWSRLAMGHAMKAGRDKVEAVDRLQQAAAEIGLEPDFAQGCLAEAVRFAENGAPPVLIFVQTCTRSRLQKRRELKMAAIDRQSFPC
jgi:hypothetical protein